MHRGILTTIYRLTAMAAIVLAPLAAVHEGFIVAALVMAAIALVAHREVNPNGRAVPYAYRAPTAVNPASGLPMVGFVDTAGNAYGTDSRAGERPWSSIDSTNRPADHY